MRLTATEVVAPVAGYAQKLHASAGGRHHVASPLGAWLLLALCATASEGQARERLDAALGCDVRSAADLAAALLARPHPAVAAAAAAWHGGELPGGHGAAERVRRWYAALPDTVAAGPLPGQAVIDDWVHRHTFGLIESLPLRAGPDLQLLVASVLAARVSWATPFDLVPAAALGPVSWARGLSQVLSSPPDLSHQAFVAVTAAAGDVAVHTAWDSGGSLAVTSVAAAPGTGAAQVLAAAYELAPEIATGGQVRRRSLFDLPLGDGPLWSLTERQEDVLAPSGREEHCTAVLPAWSASSEHNLGAPGLGFGAAMPALAAAGPWQAQQSVLASYTRTGFEAAAVSVAVASLAMPMRRPGIVRRAELRFGHPYAAVAVAADSSGHGPWHGMPVFSAWVAQPHDAAQ